MDIFFVFLYTKSPIPCSLHVGYNLYCFIPKILDIKPKRKALHTCMGLAAAVRKATRELSFAPKCQIYGVAHVGLERGIIQGFLTIGYNEALDQEKGRCKRIDCAHRGCTSWASWPYHVFRCVLQNKRGGPLDQTGRWRNYSAVLPV